MALIDRDRWGVLEPLLDHALELTDADREEWLRQLSTDSPDLASELTSLLAEDALAENAGFLTEPAAGALAGRTLGAWTLDRALGRGGMGNVWLARRTDG